MAEWGWAVTTGVVILMCGGWCKSRRENQVAKALKVHIYASITRVRSGLLDDWLASCRRRD